MTNDINNIFFISKVKRLIEKNRITVCFLQCVPEGQHIFLPLMASLNIRNKTGIFSTGGLPVDPHMKNRERIVNSMR